MARLHVKVNVSGSWANLVTCEADRIEAVKDACEAIAASSIGRISFRIDDREGRTICKYDGFQQLAKPGWHPPRSRPT